MVGGLCAGGLTTTPVARAQAASPEELSASTSPPLPAPQDVPADGGALRTYVVVVPTDPIVVGAADQLMQAMRASLRSRPRATWEHADHRFFGYDLAALDQLDEARAHVTAGRQAYLDLEFGRAVTEFELALAGFDMAAGALGDGNEVGEALLFLGASQTFAGDHGRAAAAFRRLWVQLPSLAPDPSTFNPDVVARYERAAPRHADGGLLSVETDPPGATIYVDQILRGRSPVEVSGLTAGVHVLSVHRAGVAVVEKLVDLPRRRPVEERIELPAGADGADLEGTLLELAAANPDRFDGPAAELATQLGVDRLAVVWVAPVADVDNQALLEARVYDAASSTMLLHDVATVSLQPDVAVAVAELTNRLIGAALRPPDEAPDADAILPAANVGVVEDSSPWTSFWLWAVVGGVAVAATAATLAIALTGDDGGGDSSGQIVLGL